MQSETHAYCEHAMTSAEPTSSPPALSDRRANIGSVRRDVLVIGGDDDACDELARLLRNAGFELRTVRSMREARLYLSSYEPPAMILLDQGLPDGDSLDFCVDLRARGEDLAIFFLGDADEPARRIAALELGADDYLTRPFEPRELVARARNLLRRAMPRPMPQDVGIVRFGPWRLDLVQRRLIDDNSNTVMLSTALFLLLRKLVSAPKTELSREDLAPGRTSVHRLDRIVDNQIVRLRAKLSILPGGAELIVTIRSRGYMLASDVSFV